MGQDELIAQLKQRGHLQTDRVEQAMRSVDRKDFVPEAGEKAYQDMPQPIDAEQTISAPHMVAIMTEALQPGSEDRVLEIGTGSGYQAAVLSQLVDEVHTLERIPALAERAREALDGYENVYVYERDGSEGLPGEAPFDKIIVTAAAPHVPPVFLEQLREGGLLLIPVGKRRFQRLKLFKKQDGQLVEIDDLGGVAFVPMKGRVEDQK